jgi:hypothetical protein
VVHCHVLGDFKELIISIWKLVVKVIVVVIVSARTSSFHVEAINNILEESLAAG